MKKNLLILVAAFAAFSAFGKGATQEWVRRQLSALARPSSSTNHVVTATVPTTWIDDQEGGTATCTITTEIGAHPALKVVASTVAEIPVGTFYARDSHGVYQNAKNALLPSITAVPYTTSRTTTNALGVASVASVTMGNFWATDTTGAAWYMGIDGDTLLYCATDRSRYIAIRSTTLPERAASALMPTVTARLSVRAMLALAFPSAYARTDGKTVYTVKSETTISIRTLTFTRKNKFGKETTITFTPKDLQGVYNGPNGPFNTREQARDALKNLDNWNFGDWDSIWNAEGMASMTRKEFESSDVWRQLIDAYESRTVATLVETPGMPAHPCPAPDDYWVFDYAVWNDMTLTEADAALLAWKVNQKYRSADSAYEADPEKLDKWRGENNCTCAVVGCGKNGEEQHRVGRVRAVDGQLVTTDGDEGDGCKCCVRCVKYGSDPFVTIDEYNSHRASGEGAGFCGCACDKYNSDNENEWPENFHNRPARSGGFDYACLCYCGKAKALVGEFVQHIKYSGDSPWCHEICGACGMVEDEEAYISHNWPAFDTRHVKLRDAEWSDHTPRKEAEDGANTVADPTYFQRCGCACGEYDEAKTAGLPAEFASFHQPTKGTCKCSCGQVHTKNKIDDSEVDPLPCEKICAVCFKVEDEESDAKFDFGGEKYNKIVMRDPEEEADHTPDADACGCKCYQDETTRHDWSLSGDKASFFFENGLPKWHKRSEDDCGCECGGIAVDSADPEGVTLWEVLHVDWGIESDCPLVCGACDKLIETCEDPEEKDHEPSEEYCGCKCQMIDYTTENEVFHKLRRDEPDFNCLCPCGFKHDGEWLQCGENLKVCSLNKDHTEGEGDHEFAGGPGDTINHPCVCGGEKQAHTWSDWVQTHARPHMLFGQYTCVTKGCGQTKQETRTCMHEEWTEWLPAGSYAGGTIFARTCKKCTFIEEIRKDFNEATECDPDIGFHVPAEENCGCECGYYGADAKTADDVQFHKWDPNDKIGITANCHCKCGKKHEFRPNNACPDICAYCKELRKNGTEAQEKHHLPADRSMRRCGCRCGYYGVSDEHNASGRSATSDRLHIQSKENNNSNPSAPAYCQCYGKDGTGGRRHWHYSRSTTCPDVCTYVRTGETLGHRAADHSPSTDFSQATPENHVGKTDHVSGCGCKCGLCTKDNATNWVRNPDLHQYNSSQEDRCHCACDEKVLCGDTMIDGEPHTFPITGKICTCTCGKKHRPDWLNACGLCSKCGRIWRNGQEHDPTVPGNHLWKNGGCYCDGGCVVNGSKVLPIAGAHQYHEGKCICVCGEKTRDHIIQATRQYVGSSTCYLCHAVFHQYLVTTVCLRCGVTLASNKGEVIGEHSPDCGHPEPDTPRCWACSCKCTKWGRHATCNGHYCNACCYKKPDPEPRPPIPDPNVDPNNPNVEPDPPEPYETCEHPETERADWDYPWTCEECGSTFRNWGYSIDCKLCGHHISGESNESGEHGPPCTTGGTEDPDHECSLEVCGEKLADGSSCTAQYCHACDSCPDATNHADHHGGNGNSGDGSGGGNLDDI